MHLPQHGDIHDIIVIRKGTLSYRQPQTSLCSYSQTHSTPRGLVRKSQETPTRTLPSPKTPRMKPVSTSRRTWVATTT